MQKTGLYIHIPFCNGKCPYCDFYSIASDEAAMDKYTAEVIKKFDNYSGDDIIIDTVYIGGGTPSLLGTDRLKSLLDGISNRFLIEEGAEVTAEVNPRSAASLDLAKLRDSGLNRLSVGMQSAVEEELKLLGRWHTKEDVAAVVQSAKAAGITNISLDLMIGIPHQTNENIKKSVDFCRQLGAKHISAYILKFEEGTPFYQNMKNMQIKTDDEQASQYLFTADYIESVGYKQYEISNFALDGFQSRHNNRYWKCMEYIGIGPSAHSFYKGKRFYCGRSFEDFYSDNLIPDGTGGDREEYIMLRLRLAEGLDIKEYEALYGKLPESFYQKCSMFQKSGHIIIDSGKVRFTKEGFLLSNTVISDLLICF